MIYLSYRADSKIPQTFACGIALQSFFYSRFRLGNYGLIVFIGEDIRRIRDVYPAYLRYLVLLRVVVHITRPREEVHDHLHRVLFRRVGDGLAEGGVDDDVDVGLFLYLAHSRLYLRLARLDVPLRERPVTAVDMLYEQYLGVAVVFTINNSSA